MRKYLNTHTDYQEVDGQVTSITLTKNSVDSVETLTLAVGGVYKVDLEGPHSIKNKLGRVCKILRFEHPWTNKPIAHILYLDTNRLGKIDYVYLNRNN